MLAHLEEGAIVYGELSVHTTEETARRAYFLHDKVTNLPDHLGIERREYILMRSFTQSDGYEV
jgi:hypothetical protein